MRAVPVLRQVSEAINTYLTLCPYLLAPDEPMFRGVKGRPLSPRIVQLAMQSLRGALGLLPAPHRMRCAILFATHLLGTRRRSTRDTGTWHASLSTTQGYTVKVDAARLMTAYEAAHPRARAT